jgi:DNA-binding transcriptional MerR regulator
MDHLDPLLSSADAARILGVTPATVRLMQKRGTLVAAEITTGGIRLYRRSEVDRVDAQRTNAKRGPLVGDRDGGGR